MVATTTTPTGVSTWISLGQYRSGPDGCPLDNEDVRLRCPEGHIYVSGSRERKSGEIECPECGTSYRYTARDRLRKAETLAEVEPHDGSLWHAYRRRWATVRKRLPATDVAEAGGWAGPETLQRVYQQADPETMYEVVTGDGKIREVQ